MRYCSSAAYLRLLISEVCLSCAAVQPPTRFQRLRRRLKRAREQMAERFRALRGPWREGEQQGIWAGVRRGWSRVKQGGRSAVNALKRFMSRLVPRRAGQPNPNKPTRPVRQRAKSFSGAGTRDHPALRRTQSQGSFALPFLPPAKVSGSESDAPPLPATSFVPTTASVTAGDDGPRGGPESFFDALDAPAVATSSRPIDGGVSDGP